MVILCHAPCAGALGLLPFRHNEFCRKNCSQLFAWWTYTDSCCIYTIWFLISSTLMIRAEWNFWMRVFHWIIDKAALFGAVAQSWRDGFSRLRRSSVKWKKFRRRNMATSSQVINYFQVCRGFLMRLQLVMMNSSERHNNMRLSQNFHFRYFFSLFARLQLFGFFGCIRFQNRKVCCFLRPFQPQNHVLLDKFAVPILVRGLYEYEFVCALTCGPVCIALDRTTTLSVKGRPLCSYRFVSRSFILSVM